MRDQTVEAAIAASASKTTYAGAGMSITGWLLSNEFAILFGLILGLAGFIVNWYYKHKDDRRKEREHAARMSERGYYDAG